MSQEPELTPEQEAQREAELELRKQERAKEIWQRQELLNKLYALQHGMKYTPDSEAKPPGYWREVWRHLKENLIDPWSHGDVAAWNDLKSALRTNAIKSNEMREQMMERGTPLGMTFTPVAVGIGDTVKDISSEIQACTDAIERSLEAQRGIDKAIALLEASGHMARAAAGAYALAEPVAAVSEGGAAGGMTMSAATVGGGTVAGDATAAATRGSAAPGIATALGNAVSDQQHLSEKSGENTVAPARSKAMREKIDRLRSGKDVHVKTVEEARALLDEMPDIRPATEDPLMPNPPRGNPPRVRMSEGFEGPPGTYRGDLINKQDPTALVHPDVANPAHRNFPHYNIKFKDGTKAAIIIDG